MWFSRRGAARSTPDGPPSDDSRTTRADILACFRLLLGRAPNPEEVRGHMMRVGEPLAGVVASYLNSLEFARRGLLAQDHMAGVALARLAEFRIYAAADDAAVGRYVQADDYEREVAAVFRRTLRPGMAVLDIGANIGYFTMLSAALVGPSGYVLAIEPNPANMRLLEASRRENGFAQVTTAQVAAAPATGLLVLHPSHSNGTTSALPASADANAVLGAQTVPCVRPDALVPEGQRIDLIKVDVEGAEYTALGGCTSILARDRPVIVSEFSPGMLAGISGIGGPEYLRWLVGLGYALSVIHPDGTLIPATAQDGGIGGIMEVYAARGSDHIDIVAMPG